MQGLVASMSDQLFIVLQFSIRICVVLINFGQLCITLFYIFCFLTFFYQINFYGCLLSLHNSKLDSGHHSSLFMRSRLGGKPVVINYQWRQLPYFVLTKIMQIYTLLSSFDRLKTVKATNIDYRGLVPYSSAFPSVCIHGASKYLVKACVQS